MTMQNGPRLTMAMMKMVLGRVSSGQKRTKDNHSNSAQRRPKAIAGLPDALIITAENRYPTR